MTSLQLALAHAEELLNSRNWVIVRQSPDCGDAKATLEYGIIHTNNQRERAIATIRYYETDDEIKYTKQVHT